MAEALKANTTLIVLRFVESKIGPDDGPRTCFPSLMSPKHDTPSYKENQRAASPYHRLPE